MTIWTGCICFGIVIQLVSAWSQAATTNVEEQVQNVRPATVRIRFVLSARLLPNTEVLPGDRPDGYVKVKYYNSPGAFGSSERKTEIIDNNHNPIWTTVFEVNYIEGNNQRFHFKVMDKDLGITDDEIGTVEVNLREMVNAPRNTLTKTIVGKKRGHSGVLVINSLIGQEFNGHTVLRLTNSHHHWPIHFGPF